ncbi:hypothetical protein Dimus_003959 [Dionaea muscipula]
MLLSHVPFNFSLFFQSPLPSSSFSEQHLEAAIFLSSRPAATTAEQQHNNGDVVTRDQRTASYDARHHHLPDEAEFRRFSPIFEISRHLKDQDPDRGRGLRSSLGLHHHRRRKNLDFVDEDRL